MNTFSPAQLQQWTRGAWATHHPPARPIHGFNNDTRTLAPGQCFVALQTPRRDGHDYLAHAAQAGATAALVGKPNPAIPLAQLHVGAPLLALQQIALHWRNHYPHPLIAITGSHGKTSTKDMLAMLHAPAVHATRGNLNNTLGVPLTLLELDPARHTTAAIIEVGISEPGELRHTAPLIQPDIAIITNIHPAHLAGLGTLDAIAREKAIIAHHLRPHGHTLLPAATLRHPALAQLPRESTLPVHFDATAPSLPLGSYPRICHVTLTRPATSTGYHVRMAILPGDATATLTFTLPEGTQGMAQNAALAALAAHLNGIPAQRIQDILAHWRPSSNRGEIREHAGRLLYVDCYNASPASMLDAAEAFHARTTHAPRRLFVLGGMSELGAQSAALHERVGRQLPLRQGDTLALHGGDAPLIGAGARAAGMDAGCILQFDDITAIRETIAGFAGPVFVKGSRVHALERALPDAPRPSPPR
ncbi:MAG: UDP-N-acetylmuramoyl-tripeptide--D-alanyl-D-alanine ligase [Puniceicoccales bacterium]|jgi:UDP-N-acetylmuramoyl-tripeptide--D-alanyl-D-alanine ligase|nr:UDP-N-acetylmuramoyl-tripeptide--D-alanyl-D-alanine ligase [Puniceicoccales bacterium]